jgi:hypothetical protein
VGTLPVSPGRHTCPPYPEQAPLIEQLHIRRAQLDRFLRQALPRRRHLVNASIFCSSLAALITAAPAFTAGLSEALNLSVVASVSTQLLQTSRLEALEQVLALGQFDRRAVTDALLVCIETTSLLAPGLERTEGSQARRR